jgi:Zn-finger nucleic acid-binding protein
MAYRTQSLPPGACPRCFTQLANVGEYGAGLRSCAACGGIWLGLETSQAVLHGVTAEFRALAHSLSVRNAQRAPNAPETTLQCTECAAELVPIGVPSAVVQIDACKLHGTWFDAWELSKVIRAVERGRSHGVAGAGVLMALPTTAADAHRQPRAHQPTAEGAAHAAGAAGGGEAAHNSAAELEAPGEEALASRLRNFMLEVAGIMRKVEWPRRF